MLDGSSSLIFSLDRVVVVARSSLLSSLAHLMSLEMTQSGSTTFHVVDWFVVCSALLVMRGCILCDAAGLCVI